MEVEVGVGRQLKVVKKADVGPWITRMAELKNPVDGASSGNATAVCLEADYCCALALTQRLRRLPGVRSSVFILHLPLLHDRECRHGAHG